MNHAPYSWYAVKYIGPVPPDSTVRKLARHSQILTIAPLFFSFKMAQNLGVRRVWVPAPAGAKTRLESSIRSLRHIVFAGCQCYGNKAARTGYVTCILYHTRCTGYMDWPGD